MMCVLRMFVWLTWFIVYRPVDCLGLDSSFHSFSIQVFSSLLVVFRVHFEFFGASWCWLLNQALLECVGVGGCLRKLCDSSDVDGPVLRRVRFEVRNPVQLVRGSCNCRQVQSSH